MIRSTMPQTQNSIFQNDNALSQLQQLQQQFQQLHLNQLFAQDPQRFQRFSVALDSVLFDYSKHRIDAKVLQTLVQFAQQSQLAEWIQRLFSTATGSEKINYTEQREAEERQLAQNQQADNKAAALDLLQAKYGAYYDTGSLQRAYSSAETHQERAIIQARINYLTTYAKGY